MKGNPQNIEVGDVVSFAMLTESAQAVVLTVNNAGYKPDNADTIDDYLVTCTIWVKDKPYAVPAKELTIVRKWNGSFPERKQEKSRKHNTYQFVVTSNKTKETMKLAVKLLPNVTEEDIDFSHDNNNLVSVTKNFIDVIVEHVCSYYNYKYTFDHRKCKFMDQYAELSFETFIDDEFHPVLVTLLKHRILSE